MALGPKPEKSNTTNDVDPFECFEIDLDPRNLRFIPGPKKGRLQVLMDWCSGGTHRVVTEYSESLNEEGLLIKTPKRWKTVKNVRGKWRPNASGLTWRFELEEDAQRFAEAWNSRALTVDKEDGYGHGFGDREIGPSIADADANPKDDED